MYSLLHKTKKLGGSEGTDESAKQSYIHALLSMNILYIVNRVAIENGPQNQIASLNNDDPLDCILGRGISACSIASYVRAVLPRSIMVNKICEPRSS